jgi:chromosomal replication initiator protein
VNHVVTIPLTGRANTSQIPAAGLTRPQHLREFLVGPENQLIAAALQYFYRQACGARAAGELNFEVQPASNDSATNAELHSPLFLHGPPGTGKSHLACGLAELWRANRPDETVVYVTGADYWRGLSDSFENRSTDAWRAHDRAADLFVLEDFGPLAMKPAAQVELLHTLDALADRGAHVIVTSRLPLSQMMTLLPGLASRLAGGLCLGLNLPSSGTRRAIVDRLAAERGTDIAPAARRALADGLRGSVPELFGALASLEHAARVDGDPIEMARVQQYLAGKSGTRTPTMRGIAAHTAKHYALKVQDLKSPSRRRSVVMARDVAMYLARQLTGQSLEQIGEYFGGRDHTTVLHGCRKAEQLAKSDPATRSAVERLHEALASP